MLTENRSLDRAKRVRLLKRIIIATILGMILLPTILCVILFIRVSTLQKELSRISAASEQDAKLVSKQEDTILLLQEQSKSQDLEIADLSERIAQLQDLPGSGMAKESAGSTEDRLSGWPVKVYLTFDDGPSAHTQDILDILDAYGVKGNFFVCATRNEEYLKFYKEILNRGHMLGLHSYSHEYDRIYASQEAFEEDVTAIRDFVKEQTDGFIATYYRFPGGSSNLYSGVSLEKCVGFLEELGLVYYDWNMSAKDAVNPMQPVDVIFDNATKGCEDHEEVVILMHDLGNKDSTVEALPKIIQFYQDRGSEIALIDEDSKRIRIEK